MTPEEVFERADEITAETRYRLQLQREAFERGRQSVLSDPVTAFNLAHDHGLSARQDHRPFVQAVIKGFEQGCQARKELAKQLLARPVAEREAEVA